MRMERSKPHLALLQPASLQVFAKDEVGPTTSTRALPLIRSDWLWIDLISAKVESPCTLAVGAQHSPRNRPYRIPMQVQLIVCDTEEV